jgi:hypothetical protein
VSGDPFRDEQALTGALRDELRKVRGEVEAIVRQEVTRAGIDPSHVQAVVRQAVAKELDARTPWALARIRWLGPAVGVAVGLALGLSVFAVYAVRQATEPVASTTVAQTETAAPPAAERTPPLTERADPAARAARYDSLLTAHAPPLGSLVDALDAQAPAADVRTAVAAWRLGRMSDAQRERLHAALVQSVLRAEVDSALVIDGNILREPCGGRSCSALLELWRDRGEALGLPAWSAAAAADVNAIRTVERILVLDRAERGET